MKPYRYYHSPHVTENVYLLYVSGVTSHGGKIWSYIDVYRGGGERGASGAEVGEGPLVLGDDFTMLKPTSEEQRVLIKAWFEGLV
jgi:hypothetical protein